ncbi:MAG: calcineurin [Ruminococcaceae bacterium]|nr:calcineurin [Oscillospiraceae bacterium]
MTFVTSDLHGYPLDRFVQLLEKAGFTRQDHLYVLGDVIDRGDEGIALLRWMFAQPNVTFLMGNHEAMMLESAPFLSGTPEEASVRQYQVYRTWKSNGAAPTLFALSTMPHAQVAYLLKNLENAPLYKEIAVGEKRYVLTHSGLGNFDKDKPLEEYTASELLWTRPNPLTRYYDDRTVIFGHTPTVCYGPEHLGRPVYTPTWINIDVGVAKGEAPMVMRLEDEKTVFA